MLDVLFELSWQLGFAHPDKLSEELTMPQLCGWIAWMNRRPRGERLLPTLFALQTAHIRGIWTTEPEDATNFLPHWKDSRHYGPMSEAEQDLMQFGEGSRMIL